MKKLSLVWDIPTRIFHWSLALSFAGAYLTSESERLQKIHLALGYLFLGLILFRLVWGFFGTRYARFANFIYSFHETKTYIQKTVTGHPPYYVGHNPAGSIAIFLLIGLGLVIAGSGLFIEWGRAPEFIEEAHEMAAAAMLSVVVLHVLGVAVSSFLHRENLVRAMITGKKSIEESQAQTHVIKANLLIGSLLLLVIVVFLLSYLGA